MPSTQRGSVVKREGGYGVRYYDEDGKRRRRGGFGPGRDGKRAADEWLRSKLGEVEAIRRGEFSANSHAGVTLLVADLVAEFLRFREANPDADPATTRKLRDQLKHAERAFGDSRPDSLRRLDIERWRFGLPDGNRHDVFRAFRQVLTWAVDNGLASRNPASGIKNPKRKRHERRELSPFETWAEVNAIADELDPRYRAIPVFAVGTGLRPEEWIALERRDVDREAGVVHVRRRYTQGVLKEGGKTASSERVVPLRPLVLEALDAVPPRLDTPILFSAPRGGYIDLERFRFRAWTPALRAAGIPHRRIYDCRHTFATWAIEDEVQLSYLATIMGTSVVQIEDTYSRWLKRTDEHLREVFAAGDVRRLGPRVGPGLSLRRVHKPLAALDADERT